jgi:protein tyrosine phosphatase (PTP) superfamily phosphohydrolase (DUF442 family)
MEKPLNYYQSTDNIGTSGQPSREQLADIAKMGYEAVVNLAMHDSEKAIPDEGGIVAGLGMSYIHIPVPFERPAADQLRTFCGIMSVLEGKKVWVHCAINARVSAFMFHYLTKVRGVSEQEATSPFLRDWRPLMDEAWKSLMALEKDDLGL